ncbi:membrane protein [Paractinoplanes deccanensis]|uniref:Membrane protein n=1 Tax=Paractinoplanes deccanensis TaxID=113561 RepID=A0ABQ3Y4X1_9ACTN|nr:cytochrome c oxidase assembly protein [Actinoplanes deccanensis]GID75054.1 membrane protein [Actinoplanes deccanensis]
MIVLLASAAVAYLVAAVAVRRVGGWWPPERTACWLAGIAAATAAVTGPIAEAAHHDFRAHAAGHLLLGMAAPLLLVLGAPVTLALRALPVRHGRGLSHLLASPPVRLLTHPVTAGILNAGGLWLLYTTGLPHTAAVQFHVLAAGYLFTAAIIGPDPAPHRAGPRTRAAVLIAFLAAHAILAKYLYGHPPTGLPHAETGHPPTGLPHAGAGAGAAAETHAEAGAQLMYYGGDLIDAVLIVLFCRQWYRAADPGRRARTATARIPGVRPPRVPWRLPDEIREASS